MSLKAPVPRDGKAKTSDAKPLLRLPRVVGILLAVATLVRVAALFTPPTWPLWGFDYVAFLPSRGIAVVLVLFPLVLLIPRVNHFVTGLLDASSRGRRSGGAYFFLVIATLAFGSSLSLPVAYPFLGDGALYITEVFRSSISEAGQSSLVKPSAWLSGHVVLLVSHMLDPEQLSLPYRVVSASALILTIGALWYFLRAEPRRTMLLYTTAALATPATLVFFGYVELYAIPYALSVTFFLALRALVLGRVHALVPAVILTLGIVTGASLVVCIPAYIMVLLERSRFLSDSRRRKHAAIAVESLLFAAAVILVLLTPRTPLLQPYVLAFSSSLPTAEAPGGVDPSYAIADWSHLLDVTNVLFFLLGPAVVLGLGRFLIARKTDAAIVPSTYYPRVFVTGTYLFVLCANAVFGWARDWDMAVIPVTGVIFVWAGSLEQAFARDSKQLTMFSVVFAALALSMTLPWIMLNADAQASAARFERIVENNSRLVTPHATFNGLENLRKYYTRERDGARTLGAVKKMIENGWERSIAYRHVFPLLDAMPSGAEKGAAFEWMFSRLAGERSSPSPRHGGEFGEREYREIATRMLLLAVGEGEAERAAKWAARLRSIIPAWKEEGFYRVFTDANSSPAERAAVVRSSMDAHTADPVLLDLAGQVFEMNNEPRLAAGIYAQALRADPVSIPALYLSLARVYDTQLSRPASADSVLALCVSRCVNTREAAEARRLLGR